MFAAEVAVACSRIIGMGLARQLHIHLNVAAMTCSVHLMHAEPSGDESLGAVVRMRKDSRIEKKWLRIFPKWEMVRVPASMPAIIEPKRGVSGCKREALTLFPRDELILAAVNDQHRTREVRERGQIVKMVSKQKRWSPIRRRKNVQGWK